jgi:signal transduction histidine kinase
LFGQELTELGSRSLHRHSFEVRVTRSTAPATVGAPEMVIQPAIRRSTAAEHLDLRRAATHVMFIQGGIALGIVGSAASALGWLLAGRILAPLRRVTDVAREISATPSSSRSLDNRIALSRPNDDIKDLADAFDTMIERLENSFDRQHRFVADASHELRTPLSLTRSLVELAMHRNPTSPDLDRLGTKLLEINTRQVGLINGLLLLAKSDEDLTDRYPVDLADLAAHVATQIGPEARRSGISLGLDVAEAPTTGDALLLERLTYNLVENGIRHNSGRGGWVRVTTRTRADRAAELQVSNSGPHVPIQDVDTLFEPFTRLATDGPNAPNGSGLGLSIVRSITNAHNGEATARRREGGGLEVTISLPPIRSTFFTT